MQSGNKGIQQFIERIKSAEPQNTSEFHGILAESESVLCLSDRELARQFTISVPSVKRWRGGVSAPHPVMRPHVYSFLLAMAKGLV
jgi:hypothetical protein